MKKILLSILGLAGLGFTALAGNGTQASPYTVSEVIAMGANADVSGTYVQGYIVGWVNGMSFSNSVFGLPQANENQTNILLADGSAEDDYNYCIPVQLPTANNVRNGLNLFANPDNLGHEVLLHGDIIKYFGVPGFKNVDSYEWIGEAPSGGGNAGDFTTGSADTPLTVTELLAQGIPASPVANTYVTGYIVGYVNTTGSSNVYTYSATGCEVATNLLLAAAADVNNDAQVITVQLPAGDVRTALNLVDNPGNLGKQVTLLGSHEAYFSVNGMKSITNYWWGAKGETVTTPDKPDQPNAPTGVQTVAQALDIINAGYTGTIQVQGYVTRIDEETSDVEKYGDINYYIADTKGGTPELYIYNGYFLNGEKFTSYSQIAVDDLLVIEGTCALYNGTAELARGSKILSINGENNGGGGNDEPGPGDDAEGTIQEWTKGIGFPEASNAAPSTPASYTATNTGIEYEVMGCYTNSGYLMINGKNFEGAYVSWTLDYPCSYLVLTTSSGCSTNAKSVVNVYANGNIIKSEMQVNSVSTEYSVAIPEEYQAAGTVYKVESGTTAYNQQFASFKYVEAGSGAVEEVLAADDSEAVYYNLQGVRVLNPERGIFVKVVGGKATKVVK